MPRSRDIDSFMTLRVICRDKEIVLDNVVEYVSGKQFFFVYMHRPGRLNDVEVFDRSTIKKVNRVEDDNREWTINLPQFRQS